jgi:glycosyltransferase 2 family protein
VRRWRRAAEGIALAALLYFVLTYVARNWREIRSYPWEIAPVPLVLATAAAALALVVFAALWAALLRAGGERIGYRRALPIFFVSNLARYVPGKVWQISGMAYLARRRGVRVLHAVAASLLLQLLVLAVGLLLVLAALPTELAGAYGGPAAVALLLTGAGLLAFYLSPLFERAYGKAAELLRQPVPRERLSLRQKLALGGGTALAWALYGLSFWLFLAGTTGSAPPPVAAGGIFVAGYLGGFLAFFTPGGLGVREGIYALLLGPYLPGAVALAAGLLSRVWLTALELLLAGISSVAAGAPGDDTGQGWEGGREGVAAPPAGAASHADG